MTNRKIELELDEDVFDFLLNEGIRVNLEEGFEDQSVRVVAPEWVEMMGRLETHEISDGAELTAEEMEEEEEAMGYFVAVGLESIITDRFNSFEEGVAVNDNIGTNLGVSIH
jgi:hypothetical protein